MTKPKTKQSELEPERVMFSVPEASKMLGLSLSSLYRFRDADELEFIKRGNRTFITRDELKRFVDESPVFVPRGRQR